MDATCDTAVKPRLDFISRNAPLLVLLTAYLILTVLMNIVFAVYDDRPALSSVKAFSIHDFPISTPGYWILLFLAIAIGLFMTVPAHLSSVADSTKSSMERGLSSRSPNFTQPSGSYVWAGHQWHCEL